MSFQSTNVIVPANGQFPMTLGSVFNWIRITRILTRSTILPILAQVYTGPTNYPPVSSPPLNPGDIYYPAQGFKQPFF